MATLVINAPASKVQQENKRRFGNTFSSGIGDEYAISKNLVAQISPGCCVELLDKDQELRAEGELIELVRKSKAGNGIQRYDVCIANLRMVQ